MNNAQSTAWLENATKAINEATKEATPGATINVTINYAPVTNVDNRQVHVHNERTRAPRHSAAICHPNRHQLTGSYADRLASMTRAEQEAFWDEQARGVNMMDYFIY
jgi:hypothetical protein